jgi:hypothetical protein
VSGDEQQPPPKPSNLRVVDFQGDDTEDGIVRLLELYLERARAGQFDGLMVVALDGINWSYAVAGSSAFGNPAQLQGAVLQAMLMNGTQINERIRALMPEPPKEQ